MMSLGYGLRMHDWHFSRTNNIFVLSVCIESDQSDYYSYLWPTLKMDEGLKKRERISEVKVKMTIPIMS